MLDHQLSDVRIVRIYGGDFNHLELSTNCYLFCHRHIDILIDSLCENLN